MSFTACSDSEHIPVTLHIPGAFSLYNALAALAAAQALGIPIEDAAQAERMVTILMGDKVEPRRLYISQQANFNKVDSFEGWVKG